MPTLNISKGRPIPFGVSQTTAGYNFALFSRNASAVTLLLYFQEKTTPDSSIVLDPKCHRTGDVWHVQIHGLPDCFYYMYRVDGPWNPERGHIFNIEHLLLDPYTESIAGLETWGKRKAPVGQFLGKFDKSTFDWEDDCPPNIPLPDTIIYELHVRGFSRHFSSDVKHPGTFLGIIDKIEYLKQLGITAVELLPIQEFDETDCRYVNPETGINLLNYWGYSTIGFFSLKSAYATGTETGDAKNEFKRMVKTLHAENIEVILDVVFNHTAEGDRDCPVLSFKGIENSTYYILDEGGDYQNYSGCGNTLNCNHPVVRNLIMDALRYWVVEMHVDGFRFDLASILTRDEKGEVLTNPPILEMIAKDPVLADIKIIAEAWDAAGLYQVGSFPASRRWAEWNGRYRDAIRRFSLGEPGLTGEVATRISGSEDLYGRSERKPYHSINFLTAHDGFTMMDLVSYQEKHNLQNGQDNQDGDGQNFSTNFGIEGETADPDVLSKRLKQVRNLATMLMLSQGTPMLLAGDEFGNSQSGNNNAWCQDNETSWLDWRLLETNLDLFNFWRKLILFRKRHVSLRRERFFTGEISKQSGIADISWHNTKRGQPGFESQSQSLAFLIDGETSEDQPGNIIYVALNFSDKRLEFEIPEVVSNHPWRLVLSTSDPESFILDKQFSLPPDETSIEVESFSIKVLIS